MIEGDRVATGKILLVDDDPMIRDLLFEFLQQVSDREVDCVLNGTLGAQKLRQGHFDLALIDGFQEFPGQHRQRSPPTRIHLYCCYRDTPN